MQVIISNPDISKAACIYLYLIKYLITKGCPKVVKRTFTKHTFTNEMNYSNCGF